MPPKKDDGHTDTDYRMEEKLQPESCLEGNEIYRKFRLDTVRVEKKQWVG